MDKVANGIYKAHQIVIAPARFGHEVRAYPEPGKETHICLASFHDVQGYRCGDSYAHALTFLNAIRED